MEIKGFKQRPLRKLSRTVISKAILRWRTLLQKLEDEHESEWKVHGLELERCNRIMLMETALRLVSSPPLWSRWLS